MYVDDRGYLNVQTIRNLLQNMGDCLADDEINDLLRDLKVEQQGKVKYEGKNYFIKLMLVFSRFYSEQPISLLATFIGGGNN